MLMVLLPCRPSTWVYSASTTELGFTAQVYPTLNSWVCGLRYRGDIRRPTLREASSVDGGGMLGMGSMLYCHSPSVFPVPGTGSDGEDKLSTVWNTVAFDICSMNSGMFWNTLP